MAERSWLGAETVTLAAPISRRLRPSATDSAFRELVGHAQEDVRALVDRLTRGELTPAEWSGEMLETLAQAHAEAGYRGRIRAGDLAPYDADDLRFGQLVAQEETSFLWGFQRDIEGGRYDVAGGRPAIERRAMLYADRLYGTANEALALVAGDEELWHWETSAGETCADCLRLEAHSPYRRLPTTPRQGDTACLVSCKCVVSSTSGLETFSP